MLLEVPEVAPEVLELLLELLGLYSGATGRGHPLGLARVPSVSLVFLGFAWFSLYFFIYFPWISDSVLLYPESVFLWTVSLDGGVTVDPVKRLVMHGRDPCMEETQ